MTEHAERAISAEQELAWRRYYQMQTQLLGVLNRELSQATGLSEADYEVLITIWQADGQAIRPREIRAALIWEKSRLSHQLRRMEERGLVRRAACREDSRSSVIRLTAAGRKIIVDAECARLRAVDDHLISVLSDRQLTALSSISQTVLEHLGIACREHLDQE
ncbi:MAG TPA: MarR family transcriptional regulator [Microlunatus sp.]